MYKRLITDWGILSAPRCALDTGWNSMELWSQLTVIYRCWVRSTWKQRSQSTLEWIWEAFATEAADSILLHQVQLCLNIFSKWDLLKMTVLWIFWNRCHSFSAQECAFQLFRGWQDYLWDLGGSLESCCDPEMLFHVALEAGLLIAEEGRRPLVSIESLVARQLDNGG